MTLVDLSKLEQYRLEDTTPRVDIFIDIFVRRTLNQKWKKEPNQKWKKEKETSRKNEKFVQLINNDFHLS